MIPGIRRCVRCVMDSGDAIRIEFDSEGVCTLCRGWDVLRAQQVLDGVAGERKLQEMVEFVRGKSLGRPYDSVLGASGGVDSTYLAYQAKQLGLRPLVVHLDNGWNSELAVANIENICRRLGFDLYTHVVDWQEFRDLHLAYLRASVIDVEVPTDHAINALLLRTAVGKRIPFILSGSNIATEGILPPEWIWDKMDLLNIRAIHRRFGRVPLRTFPQAGFVWRAYHQLKGGVRILEPLNWMPYRKKEAKEIMARELGWRDYGGKHYESIFTRFYQGYILPRKFGVDKRKAHLSTLICSGQITREEALRELEAPPYGQDQLRQDRAFVLKKLGLSETDFEGLMNRPPVSHGQFPSYRSRHYRYHRQAARFVRPITQLVRNVFCSR